MRSALKWMAVVVVLAAAAGPASAQSAKHAVSVGGGFHPLGTAGPVVQYDYSYSPNLSLGGRLIGLEYTYEDDDQYEEEGDGTGGEFAVTYHFRGNHAGPYISGAIGWFEADWKWRDIRGAGRGNTRGAEASASFGWRFPLGNNFYLDPSITLGNFFGKGKDSTGSRESELGVYGAVLLKVGLTF